MPEMAEDLESQVDNPLALPAVATLGAHARDGGGGGVAGPLRRSVYWGSPGGGAEGALAQPAEQQAAAASSPTDRGEPAWLGLHCTVAGPGAGVVTDVT